MAQTIQDSIEAGVITVEIFDEAALGIIPIFLIGELIYKLGELLFGLPDPFQEFMSLFSGRPTLEATADEAKIFKRYSSPVTQLLAMGNAQLLRRGIPVSSPSAAHIFGPFFGAAQRLENATRFGNQDRGSTELTNATITQAMYEAGNPGKAGTATLEALQAAYNVFVAGRPIPGDSAYSALKALAEQTLGDAASELSRGWANRYIHSHPSQFPSPAPHPGTPPPPQPPPPPAPPAKPTPGVIPQKYAQQLGSIIQHGPPGRPIYIENVSTGKWAAQWYDPTPANLEQTFPGLTLGPLQTVPSGPAPAVITFGQHTGEVVHGVITLQATFQGGPYPTAHANWLLDNRQIAETPAETTHPQQPVTVRHQWDSRSTDNGDHQLGVQWRGERNLLHGEHTITLRVQNGKPGNGGGPHPPPPPPHKPPPPPPPPPPKCPEGYRWNPQTEKCEPLPPPPPQLPWDQWFDICREVPNCQNLSQEALAVTQSIANVAGALNQIFRSQQTETLDPCCHQLIVVLASINTSIATLAAAVHAAPTVTALVSPLDAIARAVETIVSELAHAGPPAGGADGAATKEAVKALDCICKELTRIADETTAPFTGFDELITHAKARQKWKADNDMTPADLRQIMTT